MRHVANKKLGADRKTLHMLYMALIQSQINYGSFLYSSAATSTLLAIDKIQLEAIRIITGAMHCTDKSLLEAEAQLMPLRF